MALQGVFSHVIGLTYRCGSIEGVILDDNKFSYEGDAFVAFFIGDLLIGEAKGKPLLSISDLVAKNSVEFNPSLVNRARLLYSLSPGQGFETPVVIDDKVRNAVAESASGIDLDSADLSKLDAALNDICGKLGLSPKSVPHTRNHLRREAAGFSVLRDVQIPTEDGEHVIADVYLPLAYQLGKRFPALLSCTLYGRRVFHSGPDLTDQVEIEAFEKAEDDWHTNPSTAAIQLPRDSWGPDWDKQRGFENIATFNTFSYVPEGYAMVKIDPRGVSQTPGARGVPGQLTADFYDAVEWAVEQKWSDGRAALVGSSYGANTQWEVASLKPKGLKCIVPYATDLDPYREAAFTGGIPTTRYLSDWFERVQKSSPKWPSHLNLLDLMRANPFYSGLWEMIKTKSVVPDLPCFLAASQIFIIHGRAAYEAWGLRSAENTHLQLADCNYYPWPSREASGKILTFLNHYLKGYEYPVLEKVGIQVRLGNKAWYWRKETDWPVPGTQYKQWHLDVGRRLSATPSTSPEEKLDYASKTPSSGKSGISFHSEPFEEDVEFAGHFAAVLHISSTRADADVAVTLWAVDETDSVVRYGSKGQPEPLAKGFLRASHRKLDESKSRPERPWHTHTQEDNAPLQDGEVVRLDIEIYPAAARVRKGWKLRVDITPTEHQPDIPDYSPPEMRLWFGEEDEEGVNSVHIGAGRPNYVLCPVVPLQEGYSNLIM